jgi:solute carrier family 25 (mitochondrial phosphate transporter), member 3
MPEVYKGLGQGLGLASKEGALMLGWLPTLLGYSSQGMFKFGLYEIFKVRAVRAGKGVAAARVWRSYVKRAAALGDRHDAG